MALTPSHTHHNHTPPQKKRNSASSAQVADLRSALSDSQGHVSELAAHRRRDEARVREAHDRLTDSARSEAGERHTHAPAHVILFHFRTHRC